MKRLLTLGVVLLFATSVQAAEIGETGDLADGSVDGWSGISVMDGYGSIPAGDAVTTVNFYGSDARADGTRHVQPLIVMNDGTTSTIWDVGPVMTATAGLNSGAWASNAVPDDGNSYWAGFWQWAEGVNNTDGGVVSFADAGGSGMFQEDEDGTSYVPAIGDEVASGHASAAGGRAYQFNVSTAAVPEPSSIVLTICAALGACGVLRRRK